MSRKPLTTGQLVKKLQPIFNRWIRKRDEGKPCISCGEYKEAYNLKDKHIKLLAALKIKGVEINTEKL